MRMNPTRNFTLDFCKTTSSNSVTPDYWNLSDGCETECKVVANFLLLHILVGIPWNILVPIVILKKKLYQQPPIVLLLFLSVADSLILISALCYIITGFAGEYLIGSTDKERCKTCHLLQSNSLHNIPILTIALMSLDRFLYVYKPFQLLLLSRCWYH